MDADNIFNLFEDTEQTSNKVPEGLIESEYRKPDFFIGYFVGLVLRFQHSSDRMIGFLKQIYTGLDAQELSKKNKLLIYARAYESISQFDLENQEHIDALLKVDSKEFILACDKMIEELSQYEQYEKCAFLKNLKDFILFSQNKLPL